MTDTATEIEITPEMIEAGFRVLCSSGIAGDCLRADKYRVAGIYQATEIAQRRLATDRQQSS
jgi:hypothetical protein